MTDCVFCEIIDGSIPCHKIAEDDNFLAFLDIKPFSVGHTMVIPKIHYRWTYDVPNFGSYWEFTRQVSHKINTNLKPFFISYLTMGNQVEHAHIHIIPRYQNDNLMDEFGEKLRLNLSTSQLSEIKDKINL
ncbi:MAG: HIT family protein [Microgenomates group bacterium]